MMLGLRIEGAIFGIVIEKITKLPNLILNSQDISGQAISLISTDNEAFRTIALTAGVWTVPIYMIGATIVIWFYLGWAGIIGLCLIICTIPLQIYLSNLNVELRFKISKHIDERINIIGNILEGIRIIKLYT